ncbi:amidohydrolase family protein [Sphingomonas suaedae]|nr:amidohydrolase family protein [Sphingomonas suaedae]
MAMVRAALGFISLCALAVPAMAKDDLPLTERRTLSYDVSSGTFMSLAVSPDGKTILFDMLGELYAMPATGGRAIPIAQGIAFEVQPTFSPDGRWIAYVSDRSGGDNVWIARADGSAARRITSEDEGAVRTSPEWSADGKSIYVSRHRIRVGHYELWRHPVDGGPGELVAPIKTARGEQSTLGVSPSRDGNYLYFARTVADQSFDQSVAWTIVRRDIATGEETPVITNSGSREAAKETFFRPAISPDGRLLAYATRRMAETRLRVRDLTTGLDRDLGPAPLDLMNGAAWMDLIPRYAFTPDGKAILIAFEGRVERRPVDGSAATQIPFTARLDLEVGMSTRIAVREPTGPVRAKLPMGTSVAPDGTRVAYAALGSIYVQPVDGGPSIRLPIVGDPASQPGWSPDGKRIAYATWSEREGGAVWTVAADGKSAPVKLSTLSAFYTWPVFAPDGRNVLTVRSAAAARQLSGYIVSPLRSGELVAIPASGGEARVIASGTLGQRPHFTRAAPGEVHLMSEDGLIAVDLASGAQRPVAKLLTQNYYFTEAPAKMDDIRISPDGKWLAAQAREQLYLLPVPADPATPVDLGAADNPGRQVTDIGANYYDWRSDGALVWSVGNFLQVLPDPTAPIPTRHVELIAELPRARPQGSILLRGARALTMADGDRVIENADILVTGDRIAAIGPRGSFAVPAGTPTRDLGGKTVAPGLIDDHDHIGSIRRYALAYEDTSMRARLAFGVTTAFDPSTLTIDQIAYQDLIDAGLMIAPRLRSTGPGIFARERFTSREQVRAVLRRYSEAWGLTNIKQYRGESRTVRQWIAMEARAQGLIPTTEGSHNPKLILTQLLDGYAGSEHALPIAPLQEDVIKLFALTRTSYVATLLVNTSSPAAKHHFVGKYDPALDAKVRRFWPPATIAAKLAQRDWSSLAASRAPALARDTARLAEAGALVGMGAHGDDPGIGYHYEMEAHALGGMTPMAILHAATAGAAEVIGRLGDMGTLEAGKYADLVVFDRDPLTDIRNTRSLSLVMRGGQLFDADTLDELWPQRRKLPAPWFAGGEKETQWLPLEPKE